jgi:hypothetical protein
MKNPGMYIRHPKARGEWAELRFMTRATEPGFIVAKPWGDSAPFDLALAYRGHFVRVQVKCTISHRGNSCKCHLDSNGVPYRPDQIDFFAACVIPLVHPPHRSHQPPARHPPNPAPQKRQVRKIQRSLAPAEALMPSAAVSCCFALPTGF